MLIISNMVNPTHTVRVIKSDNTVSASYTGVITGVYRTTASANLKYFAMETATDGTIRLIRINNDESCTQIYAVATGLASIDGLKVSNDGRVVAFDDDATCKFYGPESSSAITKTEAQMQTLFSNGQNRTISATNEFVFDPTDGRYLYCYNANTTTKNTYVNKIDCTAVTLVSSTLLGTYLDNSGAVVNPAHSFMWFLNNTQIVLMNSTAARNKKFNTVDNTYVNSDNSTINGVWQSQYGPTNRSYRYKGGTTDGNLRKKATSDLRVFDFATNTQIGSLYNVTSLNIELNNGFIGGTFDKMYGYGNTDDTDKKKIYLVNALTMTKTLLYNEITTPTGSYPLISAATLQTKAFCVKDGSDYKAWHGSSWTTLGSTLDEATLAQGNGNIENANFGLLTGPTVDVIYYSDGGESSLSSGYTFVPDKQLIEANGDITINKTDVQKIMNFTLTAANTGAGKVRVVTSVDSGTIYKKWNGSAWVEVTKTAADVITSGNTITEFNAIPEAAWVDIFTAGIVRFTYALEIDSSSDTAYTDTLSMQLQYMGYFDKAVEPTAIVTRFIGDKLRLVFNQAGSYIVNYLK